jgi:hypothetical protein
MRPHVVSAQEELYGRVIDEVNGQALAFAEISSTENQKLVMADEQGYFSWPQLLSSPPVEVSIQYLGYQPRLVVLSGGEKPQMISMKSRPIETEVAQIVSSLPIISAHSMRDQLVMTAEHAGDLPGSLAGDVLRGLTMLPGVAATNDVSSELNVRGGNADQNLILLNQIPIYQTGHFYNLFSILNDDPIRDLTLYKNYLPVHAGDATTGILNIKLKDPLLDKPTLHADINWLTSDVFASTSIQNKFGISLSGRTTNSNVAQGAFKKVYDDGQEKLIIQSHENIEVFQSKSSPDVTFQDLIGSWNWKISESTKLSGNYFYAADDVKIQNVFSITSRNGRAGVDYTYQSRQAWDNRGGGLSLVHHWSPKLAITLDAYISDFGRRDDTQTSLSGGQNPQDPKPLDKLSFSMRDGITDHSVRLALKHSNLKSNKWQAGYQFQQIMTHADLIRGERNSTFEDLSSNIHTIFISGDIPISDQWLVSSGLRASYNSLQNNLYFSPRLQLHYQANQALTFKSSLALYNQYLRSVTLLNANNANKEIWTLAHGDQIPILTSKMAMIGGTWVTNHFTLDAEFYIRHEDGVVQELIPSNDNNQQSTSLYSSLPDLFIGHGRRYGMDIMMKHGGEKIQSILTYTLSKGEVSFDAYRQGKWINAANDRRHELNWYNNLSAGRFDWHMTTVLATGNPYYAYGIVGDSKFIPGYKALESYARFDLGLDYTFQIGRQHARIGIEVFNIFDHQNKSSVRYARLNQLQDQASTSLFTESIDLLGRTANIKFQIQIK